MESNALWQAVNTQLGATLKISIQAQADYATVKLPTIVAGDDLPDILYIATNSVIPQYPLFLKSKMADLTPYLSGDAVKEYPNLANFPTLAWKQVVFNNAIYGVPVPYPLYLWVHWVHQNLLDDDGLARPTSFDEYKQLALHFTQPERNLAGIGCENNVGMGTTNGWLTGIFGAPNIWSLDAPTGKLTSTFETDQFGAAVGAARDLWAAGAYHPNALQYNLISARGDFAARRFAFRFDGFQAAAQQFWDAAPGLDPPAKPRVMAPFPATTGGKPTYWANSGVLGYSIVKQAPPERIKEILRVLNWLASPIGTSGVRADELRSEGHPLDARRARQPPADEPRQSGRAGAVPLYHPGSARALQPAQSGFRRRDAGRRKSHVPVRLDECGGWLLLADELEQIPRVAADARRDAQRRRRRTPADERIRLGGQSLPRGWRRPDAGRARAGDRPGALAAVEDDDQSAAHAAGTQLLLRRACRGRREGLGHAQRQRTAGDHVGELLERRLVAGVLADADAVHADTALWHIVVDLHDRFSQVLQAVNGQVTLLLNNALSISLQAGNLLLDIVLIFIISIYFVRDGGRFVQWVVSRVPAGSRHEVSRAITSLDQILGSYLRTQILLALLAGIADATGAVVLGIPYAIVIFFSSFLLSLVPVIGPVILPVPPLSIALIFTPLPKPLLYLVWLLMGEQIVTNVIGPRLQAHNLRIHPLEAMAAALIGLPLAGLAGAFFAVPVVAFFHIVIREFANAHHVGMTAAATAPADQPAPRQKEPADVHQS